MVGVTDNAWWWSITFCWLIRMHRPNGNQNRKMLTAFWKRHPSCCVYIHVHHAGRLVCVDSAHTRLYRENSAHHGHRRQSFGWMAISTHYTPPAVGSCFRRNFISRGTGSKQNPPWLTDPNPKPTLAWLSGAMRNVMRRYHASYNKKRTICTYGGPACAVAIHGARGVIVRQFPGRFSPRFMHSADQHPHRGCH